MSEPIWIIDEVVFALHQQQIAEHGGINGVRDEGLLLSALNKPKNLYAYSDMRPSLAKLATSYAYGIARNHPFLDGNKRTALAVCYVFLWGNDHDIEISQEEVYFTFLSLGAGEISEEELGKWIADNLIKLK